MDEASNQLQIPLATIISILALIISLYTIYQTRNHNYLSVRPIANILPQDYNRKICVSLQNKGLGPLITKSIKFINIVTKEEKNALIDFIPKLEGNPLWKDYSKSPTFILAPNETKVLLEFSPKIENGLEIYDEVYKRNKSIIRKTLKDIRIVITYSGIYSEKLLSLKFDLTWYGRHFN